MCILVCLSETPKYHEGEGSESRKNDIIISAAQTVKASLAGSTVAGML
jgi:hypothetical protein